MLQEAPQLPLPGLQLHCLSRAQEPHHTKPYSSWSLVPAVGMPASWAYVPGGKAYLDIGQTLG